MSGRGGRRRHGRDEAVLGYIDASPPGIVSSSDRIHQLILRARPDVTVVLSYGMPAYKDGRRRLYLGVWKHGVSIYGWCQDEDGGFAARHSALKTGTGPSG
jgi:hypothetical protein